MIAGTWHTSELNVLRLTFCTTTLNTRKNVKNVITFINSYMSEKGL